MTDDFRIRCLILDDTPMAGVQKTWERLVHLDCIVDVLSSPDDIQNNVVALQEAHVALCDLTFYNFGDVVTEPAFIPLHTSLNAEKFVNEWIAAIDSWSSPVDKRHWSKNGIPGSAIDVKDIGFWLAALVSQVNPECEIVFYTSAIKEITGPLSAIAQFNGSRFGVDTKNPESPISDQTIKTAFERRQQHLLRSSPHIYQWFLRRVFLPVLLDRPPLSGTAIQLSVTEPNKVFTLKAECFFPQFKELKFASEKKSFLEKFLIRESWRLQPWEMRALHALEHELRPYKREPYVVSARAEQEEYLDQLLETAADAGMAGQGVMALLESAREELQKSSGKWPSEQLESAHRLCLGTVRNSERDLEVLCRQFQNDTNRTEPDFFRVADEVAVEPGSPAELSDPRLPFPLSYLRRVISALKHNLENVAKTETPRRKLWYSLSSEVEGGSLTITWEDNSVGFASLEDFRAVVFQSINKQDAEFRGLPLALLFGVEFAAESCRVLIRLAARDLSRWHTIYPSDAADPAVEAERPDATFGVRWKFKHPY